MARRIFAFVVLLLLVAASAAADDLGFVTIKNRFQAKVAEGIIGQAYTRIENRFLISTSPEQISLLNRAGIDYESILADIDPQETFIVRRLDRPVTAPVVISRLGAAIDIGSGMHVVVMSRGMATTLTKNTELAATGLEEMNVRFLYLPEAIATSLAAVTDFPTDSLAELISRDSLYAFDTRLENFQTRYIYTDSIHAARDWMVQKFLDWGYTDVSTPQFLYYDVICYNVMVVKQGYAEPDKTIVIGGHYDSITYGESPGPDFFAPGADDNGSGTAVTLELARILATVPTRKTIIFMPFSAEEVGLVGSRSAAQAFIDSGTDIEVMYNFDMVAFNASSWWNVSVSSGPNMAYRDLTVDAGHRVTSSLYPVVTSPGTGSDHHSFSEQGFNIVNHIESEFNTLGWHTNLDISSRLDFDYMTQVAQMAIASVAIVANAAHPTEVVDIIDQGDGQSLEVFWSDCDPNYTYTLYYGTSSGVYPWSVEITPGACSWIVDGLTAGVEYYLAVEGEAPDGYPAVYSIEGSSASYVVPRPPKDAVAEPAYREIHLNWADNREADFDYYRIYRQTEDQPYELLQDIVSGSEFIDDAVAGQVHYKYKMTAVDFDGYESDYSGEVNAYAATFDGGILVVDEIRQGPPNPSQEEQEAFFASIFGDTPYQMIQVESPDEPLTRNEAGQYSSIFWIDDDLSGKLIVHSEDTLDWYADFLGDLFVGGFRTVPFWKNPPLPPDDFIYEELRVSSYSVHTANDFEGGIGLNGWPDIQVDEANVLGYLPEIPTFTIVSGGQPIYLYDSHTDNPDAEGKPCAVYYDSPHGKRVLLGFPLLFLTEQSAKDLVAHVIEVFGEGGPTEIPGDIDNSGEVDISDLVYLIDYMFRDGPRPQVINSADVNASCQIDISDLVYLIDYMFLDGPPPLPGCVE